MNFKRFFALLAAALMLCIVLTAVACDGGEGEQTTDATTTDAATTQAPATEKDSDTATTEAETESGKVT